MHSETNVTLCFNSTQDEEVHVEGKATMCHAVQPIVAEIHSKQS